MGKNGFLAVFFLLLIVADVSNASLIWKFRKLVGVAPEVNSTTSQITPSPSPDSDGRKLDPKPKDGDKSIKKNSKDPSQASDNLPTADNLPTVDPKVSNNTVSVNRATANQTGNPKNHEKAKKSDTKTDSQARNDENCVGITNKCTVPKTLIACIRNSERGSKELTVLVQNEGEDTLKVNLIVPASEENAFFNEELKILKHQTERINISLALGKSTKLKVNAGNGECTLTTDPFVPERNYILRLPSYDTLVTPVNGAYFLILTFLIFGGTWTCCKFWKRRWQGGVPYQELEMGLPESASATNVETAEGWDNGWDDDWDEENAVKSPGGRYVGNISANGLTARSSNKDGWENDWDD